MSDYTKIVDDGSGNTSSWNNLQISSKAFCSMPYGNFRINIYEHTDNFLPVADSKKKRYFYSPLALLDQESATYDIAGASGKAEVRFRIELWNEKVEKKIAEYISDFTEQEVKPARVQVMPFEKVILFSSSPSAFYQLQKDWTQYQGQMSLWFTVTCNDHFGKRLVQSIRTKPERFSNLELLYGTNSQSSTDRQSVAVNFTTESGLKSENQFSDLQNQLNDAKGEIELLKNKVTAIPKDEKSVVTFDAYRTSKFDRVGATVTFEGINVNAGNGMDINNGIFTAPVDGIYSFEFHGHTCWNGGRVYLKLNGEIKTTAHAACIMWIPISCSVTIKLKTGDVVCIVLSEECLYDTPSEMFTHFSGRLL